MQNTLKLKNPILINNKAVDMLTYDTNEITGVLFSEAEAMRKRAAGMKNVSINPAIEFDFALHLYLGFAAILAINPEYDFSDMERIHGADLMEVMAIGRNFTMQSEEYEEKTSGGQSGTTPEPTTPAPESLNSGE